MTYYLDASVLVPRLLDEASSAAVQQFVVTNNGQLNVSNFAAGEVSSAIAKASRDQRLTTADAHARLVDFDLWRAATTIEIIVLRSDLDMADALVRRLNLKLRFPDAIHAACCQRLGLTLATFDVRLDHAAGAIGLSVTRL